MNLNKKQIYFLTVQEARSPRPRCQWVLLLLRPPWLAGGTFSPCPRMAVPLYTCAPVRLDLLTTYSVFEIWKLYTRPHFTLTRGGHPYSFSHFPQGN